MIKKPPPNAPQDGIDWRRYNADRRTIEQMNERNRVNAQGRPYLYTDPDNATGYPTTVIGLKPGQGVSFDEPGTGKHHTFFVRPQGGPVQHTEADNAGNIRPGFRLRSRLLGLFR
jgi:hypothetical protein